MADDRYAAAMLEFYERGLEADRLVMSGAGLLEFERTQEIVLRHLPPPPAVIADIGGGPGRYALWLARLGYRVVHRDVVPLKAREVVMDSALAVERVPELMGLGSHLLATGRRL
jgi:hypothetical protein